MSVKDALLLLQQKGVSPNFVYRYTYYGFIPMLEIINESSHNARLLPPNEPLARPLQPNAGRRR